MESNHKTQPGFCSDCGTVLPLPTSSSGVTCYTCEKKWDLSGKLFKNQTLFKNQK